MLTFLRKSLLPHKYYNKQLEEEEVFEAFCHIMFDQDLRDQYKPDMVAVQVRLNIEGDDVLKRPFSQVC